MKTYWLVYFLDKKTKRYFMIPAFYPTKEKAESVRRKLYREGIKTEVEKKVTKIPDILKIKK